MFYDFRARAAKRCLLPKAAAGSGHELNLIKKPSEKADVT
jgi:hypothetical protein